MSGDARTPFADSAVEYHDRGLRPFPVRGKTPAVAGWNKRVYRRNTIERWAKGTFAGMNIGVPTGPITMMTVIDIDAPELRDYAFDRFGQTPVVVQTGTQGHLQAYYRYGGERNAKGIDGLMIDVRGDGGMVVAPPSITTGEYRFERGSFDDLQRLPPVVPGSLCNTVEPETRARNGLALQASLIQHPKPVRLMIDGDGRNTALFKYVKSKARQYGDEAALLECAYIRNREFAEPLPLAEVQKIVGSIINYLERGDLWADGIVRGVITAREVEILRGNSDAVYLLVEARINHAVRNDPFAFGTAMAARLGWGMDRFRKARDKLCETGFLRCVHQGGRGKHDPSLFILCEIALS